MMEDEDAEVQENEVTNLEAKLRELLHKINSFEIKLCSDATKEFIKLLNGNSGNELLRLYVQSTSCFSELLGAMKIRQGKPGISYILSLISAILSHPDGKYKPKDKERIAISVVLDKFARTFIDDKLEELYKELTSNEGKRQNAALLLMTSIVRRGSGLASDVAKKFDFKLKGFSKLAEFKKRQTDKKRKHSTRRAFVGFAMSFLEMGKPGLLRWILQQRDMYSGVLRGLWNDDDETVVYILSTLRDRILTEDSLVPPSLRSVLFGSLVLEQLVGISGRENCGSAEIAHNVLLLVCTDPSNGLMPDYKRNPIPLRGNPRRLLELMKKLKATEIVYHRDLLLAIVRGKLSFGSAFLKEFPYNLEDYSSPSWLSTVSLAANLISSMLAGSPFLFLDSASDDLFDSTNVQHVMNIYHSRPLSRSMINKGLLHSDFIVKNGTLRLLLEALKLLDFFFRDINLSCNRNRQNQRWKALEPEIQNEIQTLLPDSQVLLTLLSTLSSHVRTGESCLKRRADKENFPLDSMREKKPRTTAMNVEADIIIGGISLASDVVLPSDSDKIVDSQTLSSSDVTVDFVNVISELWGDIIPLPVSTLKDAEVFFYSKLLGALKIYLLRMPTALEGSFEFFMNLLGKPSELPSNLLDSLLSLLVEYIRTPPGSGIAIRTPPLLYKHLQAFLNLLIFSPVSDIKCLAYNLAQAAMSSTGAFDRNLHEILAWLSFLPGYSTVKSSEEHEEVLQSSSAVVISFLCDAVKTIGNNLFRYWDVVRNYTYHMDEFRDSSPEFSPLVTCVLQKCIRLLNSNSGTFSLSEKSMISVYVCNTLKFLLQIQVDARFLASLISSALSEGLQDCCSAEQFCEWRPFKNLLLFAESILHKKKSRFFLSEQRNTAVDRSFMGVLREVRKIVERGHAGEIGGTARAFSLSIICTTSDEVLKNFLAVMTLSQQVHLPFSFLSFVIYLEQSFLADILKLWPSIFLTGLEKASSFVDSQNTNDEAVAQETVVNVHFDARESAAADAFSLFLGQAPFHILFPAILFGDGPHLSEFPKLKDMLMAKLVECTSDFVILYLRLVLFWFYQIQGSYRIKPLAKFEGSAELCCMLVKHMLAQLVVCRPGSGDFRAGNLIREAVETICCHPVVKASFTYLSDGDSKLSHGDSKLSHGDSKILKMDFTERNFGDNMEAFLLFCQRRVNLIDCYVLDILKTTFDCLPLLDHQHCILGEDTKKQIMRAFKTLKQGLYMELKERFNGCTRTDSLLPLLQPFHALHNLIQLSSPFELIELANWIFDRVELNGLTGQESCWESALLIGFCIASDAFKMLSIYLEHPVRTRELLNNFWDVQEKDLDVSLIEEMYVKQCKFASTLKLDFAYSCLLDALTAVYRLKSMKCDLLDPLGLVLSRVILHTPMDIVFHCVYETSKTKSNVLYFLVDMSPMHLSVFGYVLSEILSKNFHFKRDKVVDTFDVSLSTVDYTLLLPAACSYLNSVLKLEMPFHKLFTRILKFYSELLLKGFCDWKNFVSGDLFQENHDIFLPSSIEEFFNLFDASHLGKAMHMLKCHFVLNGHLKVKQRLKIVSCLLTCSGAYNELLDCEVDELEIYPFKQSLNLVNRVAAKISVCRMMLFSDDNKILSLQKDKDRNSETTSLTSEFNEEGQSRMHFMLSLVNTWQCMVRKFPSDIDSSKKENSVDCLQLYRYLELFILKNIHELLVEMCGDLIQLQNIPFLEQLVKSSLLYRFEDSKTLNVLRSILTLFWDGKFSYIPFLQLLLAHSHFASTIHCVIDPNSSQTGAFFRPMPSILKSIVIPHSTTRNESQATNPLACQLEILKLLRTLIHLKHDQTGCSRKDNEINFRELYLLLLTLYGATLSEIDLEIYGLMSEIESIDKSASADLVDLDYLWGPAALKIRKRRALDRDASSQMMTNTEAFAEHRRSQFRENLTIDPKICAATVIYYPYDRTVGIVPWAFKNMCLEQSPSLKKIKRYDPIFILRFSIQILSMGYIEPVEFAGLGLLAIAFVSMSSPDVEMRKLAYHFIQKLKETLARCQKKKDIMLLRLLVIYMQNGVEDNWQRISSITAIFAAEASLILLDPANDHYKTLCNHLMHSSMKHVKGIPFFRTFFESNSVNLRAERLWMLRLAWAGLNLDDDANLYVKNSIPRTILSFYCTPLADNASKELVLQVVKKSVKLHDIACDLVKKYGLISWLSSVISNSSQMKDESDKMSSSLQLAAAIEVVVDILQAEEISECLQHNALEQLMELASNLYKCLVRGLKLMKDNVPLIDSILQIMISTMKLSQNRMINEPRFTLSFEGLYQIYKACYSFHTSSSCPNIEFGLTAILMSTPPVDIFYENQEKLSDFLMWAVSIAMKLDSKKSICLKDCASFRMDSEELSSDDEPMILKLLRWLVSAVILSKLYWKLNDENTKFPKPLNPKTLQSLLEYFDIGCGGNKSCKFDCSDVLATTILFLQQQLGLNMTTVSSVVSALSILLFCSSSKYSDLLNGYGSDVVALQSRIGCPAEANPEWRWSYDQAWRDLGIEKSDSEKMDEYHACQSLMVVISNILKNRPLECLGLSHQDKVISDVFEWERNCLESKGG